MGRRPCQKCLASYPQHGILEKEPTRRERPQRTGKDGVRLNRKRGDTPGSPAVKTPHTPLLQGTRAQFLN